jgi:hypothetical protein
MSRRNVLTAEAIHYGYPPNLRDDTFDCEPQPTPASSPADPDNTFLYWLFLVHKTISTVFPGPIGLQKSLSAIQRNDQKIRHLLSQLPPELHISETYSPLFDESPLSLIRRYLISTLIQGYLLTLHRPYTAKFPFSRTTTIATAWTLVHHHTQIISLSGTLDSYQWLIEEFLDPHYFRAAAILAGTLLREPDLPDKTEILAQLTVCVEQTRGKALRKRDYAKTYGIFVLMERTLTGSEETGTGGTVEGMVGGDGEESRWEDTEILTESMFRWDEYMVDMVLGEDDADV